MYSPLDVSLPVKVADITVGSGVGVAVGVGVGVDVATGSRGVPSKLFLLGTQYVLAAKATPTTIRVITAIVTAAIKRFLFIFVFHHLCVWLDHSCYLEAF